MPKIVIRGDVLASGSQFQLEGFPRRAVTSVFVQEGIIERETEIQITGIPDIPAPTVSAHILGLPPSAQESTTITTLSAELRLEDGTVQEPYDPNNWTWSVVSGGGSFTGDDLTLPAAPATVVIEATHPESGLSTTAEVEVVAAVQRALEIYNVPANVIQGRQYTLLARELDSATNEVLQDPATGVGFAVTSGPATITGGNTLNINAGSAPGTVQVSATKAAVTGDSNTYSVIAQPVFPNNEPQGTTPLLSMDGSTLTPPGGFTPSTNWDDGKHQVVVDPNSKFGSAIQKNWEVGDGPGWNGLIRGGIGEWTELYFRFVFQLSDNWEFFPANSKLIFYDKSPEPHFVLWAGARVGFNDFGSGVGEYDALSDPDDVQSTFRLSRGVYHTFEAHHRASLTPNTGFFRLWIDGVEYTHFVRRGHGDEGPVQLVNKTWLTTADDADKRIGGNIEFPFFWGGGGFNKTVNDYIRFSEMYVSGRD